MLHFNDVIEFWFKKLKPEDHFKKNLAVDRLIEKKFSQILEKAKLSELFAWRAEPLGRLAEIIVLDQFSRNIHRDSPLSFAADPIALVLAQEAVHHGIDQHLELKQRSFLYMPYMHSESLLIHEQAINLFSLPGLEFNLDYEMKHKQIIERFGRYPHRNKIVNRQSTPEEVEFLKSPGTSL